MVPYWYEIPAELRLHFPFRLDILKPVMSALVAISILLLLLAGGFYALFRQLAARPETVDFAAWLAEAPACRYRPMQRLLDDRDCQFLASYPRLDPAVAARLRAERRRVFRAYMTSLRRDFARLYGATKLALLYSPEDRPDLAAELLRQRFLFTCSLLAVEWRLLLHAVGVTTVDVRGLVSTLEDMRIRLLALAPALADA